jgi:hypothetical protein
MAETAPHEIASMIAFTTTIADLTIDGVRMAARSDGSVTVTIDNTHGREKVLRVPAARAITAALGAMADIAAAGSKTLAEEQERLYR